MSALAVVVACALGAAPGAELQASLRTEVSGRHYDPRDGASVQTQQVLVEPLAQADLRSPDVDLSVRYQPRLTQLDAFSSTSREDVLHEGSVRLSLVTLHPWTVSLEATATSGRTDLVTQLRPGVGDGSEAGAGTSEGSGGGTGSGPPPIIPTARVLGYQNGHVDLVLSGPPGRRSTLSLTAAVSTDGGSDAPARQVLPTQRAVRGEGVFTWRAGRRDALELRLTTIGTRLPTSDRDSATGTAVATWRRDLGRSWQGWAGAGAVAGYFDGGSVGTQRDLYPAGELGLTHRQPDASAEQEVLVRMGAGVDRLTGEVSKEQELQARARWTLSQSVELGGRAQGGFAQQVAGRSQRAVVEARVGWVPGRLLMVDLGAYGQGQRSAEPAIPTFVEWGAYLAFTVRTPAGTW